MSRENSGTETRDGGESRTTTEIASALQPSGPLHAYRPSPATPHSLRRTSVIYTDREKKEVGSKLSLF
jgi:hypothetical protein